MKTIKIFQRNFEGIHKKYIPTELQLLFQIINKIPAEKVSVPLGYFIALSAASRLGQNLTH